MPDVYQTPADDPEYRWVNFDAPVDTGSTAIDAQAAIADWNQLDGVLENFPKVSYPGMFPENPASDGRYRLGHWWFCLFERHWSLRGMTNALTDYYTDPDQVHRLFRGLTDFYKGMMERAKQTLNIDGIFTSDDIGTQTCEFFSPAIFDEFFKPYYKEIFEKAHELDMHFWLHACGNIKKFIPELIDIGLDVLHPIQKYTMDERVIAREFGNKLCIWSGFDVQQIIPWGTPQEVRQEVRYLFDTYYRPEGRLIFTAGNAIHQDCPIESLEALYEEAFEYGLTLGRNRL
jgi:uroporphyrinogen-III decarboxylase